MKNLIFVRRIFYMKNANKFFVFLLLSILLLSSCKSLRNHIREQQEASKRDSNFQVEETDKSTNNNGETKSSKSFYSNYSQKLGVKLSGKEDPAFIKEITTWLGTPYLYGGNTKGKGTDCSGMIQQVYLNVYGIKLERSALNMMNNVYLIDKKDLQCGDLIFFKTIGDKVSHVALYINENKFIHASSSRGVIVNDLDESYWKKHYYACGRIKKK
jgi:lipoprotein Spr